MNITPLEARLAQPEQVQQEPVAVPEIYFSSLENQETIRGLISHFNLERKNRNIPPDLVVWNDLEEMLSPEEMAVIKYLDKINPRDIGFYGPRVEDDGDGSDLIQIEDQTYIDSEGSPRNLPPKFIPKPVHQKIELLNKWIQEDGLEPLLVESGYRSPAYQSVLFLRYLTQNEFDIKATARRVALPGYSEHGSLQNTAVDLTTAGFLRDEALGKVTSSDFAHTDTCQWLITKGKQFGVAQTCTVDNVFGIQPEPWHFTVNNEDIIIEPAQRD